MNKPEVRRYRRHSRSGFPVSGSTMDPSCIISGIRVNI